MTGVEEEIGALTREFFGAFTNKGRLPPDVDRLYRLLIPQAVITKRAGPDCEIYDVKQFIEPRRQLLTGGRLVDFEEAETSGRTDFFGGIAQRFCRYRKAGVLDGRPFTGTGTKSMQFIKLDGEWRISAVAWEDDSPATPPGDIGPLVRG